MLKRLTILAVLLTCVAVGFLSAQNAPSNAPEHGIAKAGDGQNGGGQPQAADGKQATPNTPPPAPQPAAPTCDEACQQGRQNLAIQRKLELFTGVLAIVGILQVATMAWQAGLLWGTLRKIKRQADLMEQQGEDARRAATDATTSAQSTLNAIERQVINMRRQVIWLRMSAKATRLSADAALIGAKAMQSNAKSVEAAVNLSQDTAMKQLRAYLCVSKGRLNFTKEGPLEPQLHIVNGGQTPAYEVRTWIDTAVREFPPFGPLNLAESQNEIRAVGIIPPQGENTMVSRKVPKDVADSTFLQTRWKILYVYGEITYKDAFGESRFTKFRLIFGGPAGCRRKIDKEGAEMGYLSMDPEGNEAN